MRGPALPRAFLSQEAPSMPPMPPRGSQPVAAEHVHSEHVQGGVQATEIAARQPDGLRRSESKDICFLGFAASARVNFVC